jgi:hypothetical protein
VSYFTTRGQLACSTMSMKRYRCGTCGNLTRFEVVMTRRVREIHHIGVDGTPVAHRPQIVAEAVEQVICGWCEQHDRVEELRPVSEVS